MEFNSYLFAVFFLAVLAWHHAPISWRANKAGLLVASYLFYAAWDPPFVLLLWISTVADWFVARAMARAEAPGRRRALLLLSLAINLGMLAYFKYGGFLLENFAGALQLAGIDYRPAAPDIILPIGISFYTFETLSYTIDVYRRQCAPYRSFLDYALLLTFFPHLVAGPILRPAEMEPQFATRRRATTDQLGWGLALLVLGLFSKNVVADVLLAPTAEAVFAHPAGGLGPAECWLGTLAFAGQIFCDFAGYSTCAIGVALCLGFEFPDNFRFPYAAIGFSDFWRRWHISLSSWLRDYLYIPLGGNRHGGLRTAANLMATMLLGGLWHGASWTFVAWGGLHGLYLSAERLIRSRVRPSPIWRTLPARLLLAALTFALVCIAWTFFRADSISRAVTMTAAMLGLGEPAAAAGALALEDEAITIVLVTIGCLLALHWLLRDVRLERAAGRCPWPVRSLVIAALIAAIAAMPGDDRAFIYFQF